MLIKIDDITEGGLRIQTRKDSKWVTNIPEIVNDSKGLRLKEDILFNLELEKVINDITVTGSIEYGIETECSRCLDQVDIDYKTEVNLILIPRKETDDSVGDVDYETYEGENIDLSSYLREQIAITLPYRVVCKELCKGLCPKCGTNLNENECDCDKELKNSAFSVLKGIKL